MVDDRTQRPFGSTEPARSAPKAGGSSNDPLAELARLIGQNDPFGEFGGNTARRASAPPAHEPPQAWTDVPQATPEPTAPQSFTPRASTPEPQAVPNFLTARPAPSVLPPNFANHDFGKQDFSKPQFGSAPQHNDDLYHVESAVPAFAQQPPAQGYENDPYQPAHAPFGEEQGDYYEEEPPSRRRVGVLVIAGVFALAVIGTAGAFGYRAIFGSSSSTVPPPVIKADTTPSKVMPAVSQDAQPNKQITDRINEKGAGERIVSREERPVAITPQPDPVPQAPQTAAPPSGTGVVGGAEPKKVRTIAIRPDQGISDPAAAQPAPQAAVPPPAPAPVAAPGQPAPVRVVPTAKPAAPPARVASVPPADDVAPAPAPRAAANAPLSLNPGAAPARAPAPAPVARTAAVAPAASSGGGGYLVQVSSQRSEAEAQSAFASLQGKFPGQLGGKQAVIRKVELGEKGTYYRAMVPAGDAAEANQLCSGMKAAGGSCLVQKN